MYNTNAPTHMELPSSRQLIRSTVIAAACAGLLLVTVVLPSEYGIDPTGAGRILGLTQMGEIKQQLAQEAAADVAAARSQSTDKDLPATIERRPDARVAIPAPQPMDGSATGAPQRAATEAPTAIAWQDEVTITLTPGQGIEYKLVMVAGAEAEFEWSAKGGVLNFDTHGDGSGNSISYEKGRGVATDSGVLRAAFDGNHGWFWRNRTDGDVTLTLRTRGGYSELKRTA